MTGASGYIGQVLCPILREHEHTVRALDIAQAPGVESFDVVTEDLPLEGVDVVIPLAGYVGPKCERAPALARDVNQVAAERLAKKLDGRRCIYLTTDSGYPPGNLTNENEPFAPKSVYACTKAAGAEALRAQGATVFRLASLFGVSPNMRDDLLLHFLVKHTVKNGRLPGIRGPDVRRSFVHVGDVCHAVVRAVGESRGDFAGGLYNLTARSQLRKMDVALMISEIAGLGDIGIASAPNDDLDERDFWLDGSRWGFCLTSVRQALPALFAYYRRQS